MGRIMKIKLSICGKVMKFSPIRNDNSKLDSKKISRSRTYSELSDKVQTDKEGEKLFRANMKSRRWFLETMSQLKRQPDTFISASFPSDSKACSMAKLSKKYFNNFTKKMLKQFPKCYAVWKLEIRPGRGIHYHMIARFRDHGQKRREVYKKLKENWEEMFAIELTGERIFLAEKYVKDNHEGYLVKKSKIAEEMRCKRLLEGKRAWGIVGKKNILFHKEETFELAPKEHQRLVEYLKRYIEKHPELSSQYAKQLSRSAGSLYLFPEKELKNAIEYATACRFLTEHEA